MTIQKALDQYKERVLEEAKEALKELQAQVDSIPKDAIRKLECLVESWEEATRMMSGFGLTTIADIALSGGIVWAIRTDPNQPYPNQSYFTSGQLSIFQVLDNLKHDQGNAPSMYWSRDKSYEAFIMVRPAEEVAKKHETSIKL